MKGSFFQWMTAYLPQKWLALGLWHLVSSPPRYHFLWDQTFKCIDAIRQKECTHNTNMKRKNEKKKKKRGGYHKRSIKIIDPASIVMGLSIFSICSTEWIDLPMPPCIQIIFFSIRAASGRWLKSWLNLVHAHIPSCSPYKHLVSCRIDPKNWIKTNVSVYTIRSMHSIRKPNNAFMSAASWFPRIKWTLSGYSICTIRRTPAKVNYKENEDQIP